MLHVTHNSSWFLHTRCAHSGKTCCQQVSRQAGMIWGHHGINQIEINLIKGSLAAMVGPVSHHNHNPQAIVVVPAHPIIAHPPSPYSCSHSLLPTLSKQPPFQPSAGSKSPTVCALCLGQETCDILKCQSSTFWDGSKARCQKNNQGWLISLTGLILCFDWNIRQGCKAQGHNNQHKCSGCGNKDHRAQKCPWAQKKQDTHSL